MNDQQIEVLLNVLARADLNLKGVEIDAYLNARNALMALHSKAVVEEAPSVEAMQALPNQGGSGDKVK